MSAGSSRDSYDAVVVGSGATGGLAAKLLTEAGLRVALFEAGSWHSPTSAGAGAKALIAARQAVQSACYAYTPENAALFVDDVENPYSHPDDAPFNWIRGRQVGGRLHTWARMSVRMSDFQFKAASRDGFGEDWPISYSDLAPYYDVVERLLQVRGEAAGLAQLPDGAFVEPPPVPAAARSFEEAVERRWPTRGVTLARSAQSPTEATLLSARETGRLALFENSVVSRVLAEAGGERAQGVAYVDRLTGSERELSASAVLLCASTIESTRLLLNSAGDGHPYGLGNSSGTLGRYLSDHTYGPGVRGAVPRNRGGGPRVWADCIIPAFRNVTEPGDGFLRGYGVQMHLTPPERRGLRRVRNYVAPGGGRFLMFAFGEVLGRSENRVTIDPDLVDAWGIPAVRIECRYGENETAMAADQVRCIEELADAAGFEVEHVERDLAPPGSSVHELGTARMGVDPAGSVLNRHNQCWDVPNLFVTDGACFTSSGSQNPTLTMMAITARACEFAIAQMRRPRSERWTV